MAFGFNKKNENYEYEIARLKKEKAMLLEKQKKNKILEMQREELKSLKREAYAMTPQGKLVNKAKDFATRFVVNTMEEQREMRAENAKKGPSVNVERAVFFSAENNERFIGNPSTPLFFGGNKKGKRSSYDDMLR